MYIENAIKYIDFSYAFVLANCFINMYSLKCRYNDTITKDVEKYCPNAFKKELRVPDFYLNIVESKINKIN